MKRINQILVSTFLSASLVVLGAVLSGVGFAHAFTGNEQQTTSQSGQQQQSGANYILPGGGGNASQSGRDTSKNQLITAAANIGAAAMYMSICSKPKCAGCWACPLVGMASAAAGMLGSSAKGSAGAGADMSAYNPNGYYGDGGGSTGGGQGADGSGDGTGNGQIGTNVDGSIGLPDGTTPQTIARDVGRIRAELDRNGVSISPDGQTMRTPDGRMFNLGGDGSSQSGLMAMGLSAEEAAAALDAGKKFAAKNASKFAQMKQLPDAGGGGGGLRGPAADAAGDGYGNGANAWDQDPRRRARQPAKVSGLTKKLGDDTIGVSGDNIFEMITRRYQARDKVNQFLKD
ncbi:MAG: hypothetical protein RBT63_03000 [Bdellovibrionales bacterium]|jgi:hypothetical protein|nr:hypothetical protein [Bdellovibrionales bacterium]